MAGRPGRSPSPTAASARKGKAAPSRAAAKPTLIGRVFAKPGVIFAGASFAAVMTGIVANALVLQHGHHPSPLFSPAAVEAPAAVPVPPPAPRQVLAQPASEPVAEAAPPSPAQPVAAPALQAPPAAASKPSPGAKAAPHAAKSPTVAHAQPHPAAATAHKEAAAPARKAALPAHKDPIAQLIGGTH